MPSVRIMVTPPIGKAFATHPYHLHPKTFEFSRIPCVGEVVSLGSDDEGIAADYRIVIVHHVAGGNPVDAELYARRVDILDVVREVGLLPPK